MASLLDRFDEQAAALAATAREIGAIDAEVDAVNCEALAAKKASLDAPEPITTSHELFRMEPDIVEPDQTVFEDHWFVGGRPAGSTVTAEWQGKQVLADGNYGELRRVPRTVPGRIRRGRRMICPLAELRLPATRLGREPLWPGNP